MTSEISQAAPVTNMASVRLRVEEERKRRGSFPVSGLEQLLRSLAANEVVSVSHIPFFSPHCQVLGSNQTEGGEKKGESNNGEKLN